MDESFDNLQDKVIKELNDEGICVDNHQTKEPFCLSFLYENNYGSVRFYTS